MQTSIRVLTTGLVFAASVATAQDAQHPTMPPGMTHEEHLAQMRREAELKERGAAAMGFDQDKTQHHFRLTPDGGTIEVVVRDSADDLVRAQVRSHLRDIAADFAEGRFGKPLATHAEVPPGVQMLKQRKERITYVYEALPDGGRIVIATKDRRATIAVHDFLRYQIREHNTGDPLQASK